MSTKTPALLKNRDQFLPIDLSKIPRVAVIGKLAKQIEIEDKSLWSILKKAANIELEFAYAEGHFDTNEVNETLMNKAQRAASVADVAVIFVGYFKKADREKTDKLPTPQNVLVDVVSQVEKNVVVVVLANSEVKMPWKKQVRSILQLTELDSKIVNFLFVNNL
ncbi:MAG: beta-glucosidase [Paraglaciecola sp.]